MHQAGNLKITTAVFIAFFITFSNSHIVFSSPEGDPVSTVDSLDKNLLNWYNFDPVSSGIQGTAVDKAYNELLVNKKPGKKIIVAVIDGGVDINHEDLIGKIWTNSDEIPDNGIDDDNNGYVDDIHGWNFIGNKQGENVKYETFEFVRIYRKYDSIYSNVNYNSLSEFQKPEYQLYLKSKLKYQEKLNYYQNERDKITSFERTLFITDSIISDYLKTSDYNIDDLKKIYTPLDHINRAKGFLLSIYGNGFTKKSLEELKENNSKYLEKHLNLNLNPREIIGDNQEDISETNYGNNNVVGPRAEHGTFVAGIIAANRNNGIGINGITENVEIMVLRTIPDGDEYDKDVALSIQYAVRNGANIINMSFGKNFSPNKKFVDEALKYAEENNVLLIHAAGNDADNVDEVIHYPSKKLDEQRIVNNWITVGANNQHDDKYLPGIFSNYGKANVDLFAPGVDLISLNPENRYQVGSGTSFSSPVVTGIAALVWSYYPNLSAAELKELLLHSTTQYGKLKVYVPNLETRKKKKTRFYNLSDTGGVINAYNAFMLAEQKGRN